MTYLIRRATLDDARAIGEVHIVARQAAYAHFFDPNYLTGLTLDYVEPLWRQRLEGDGWRGFVAADGERVLGAASYGANHQGLPEEVGELLALHIHPDAWRLGIGTALIGEVEAELRALGYKSGVLWVYKQNDRARRFYESRGWQPEGTVDDTPRGKRIVRQLRYTKPLQ